MSSVKHLNVARKLRPLREAEPVVKWAGGKTKLLPQLEPLLPRSFGRYFEPFVGGGALFFRMQPGDAQLSDINRELINLYTVVRDRVDDLISAMAAHRYERDYYYRVRATDPETLPPVERAARMLFLNRSCFNGLYRVNRRGQFNVPFGRYKNPVLCHVDRLHAAASALANTQLRVSDYVTAVERAGRGDFVYFDPPYHPLTPTANFTSYTAGSFREDDQRRLADAFRELGRRGVLCMLSNSDTEFIRELYADFNVHTVQAPRAISRNGNGRQPVPEVVVCNY